MTFSKKLMKNLPLLMMWPPFLCLPSFPTAYGVLSKNPLMTAMSKNTCMVFKQKSLSIKLLISILESSKDDQTNTPFTSVIQMLCSTHLDISRLRRVFVTPFFKPEKKNPPKTPYHPAP